MNERPLRQQVLSGSIFSLASLGCEFVVRFAINIWLARLLSRQDFGIVAVAQVLLELTRMLQGMGLGSAVVQQGSEGLGKLSTAFALQSILATGVFFVLFLFVAPSWGQMFHEPAVVNVVRVESLLLLMNVVSFIPRAACQVNLRFGVLSFSRLLRSIIALSVSIVLAFYWRSYWALVVGHVTGGLVETIILLRIHPYRPTWKVDPEAAISLMRLGKVFFALELLQFVARQGDRLVTGKVLDLEALGIYFQSQRWGMLVVTSTVLAVQRLFFSAYSRKKDEPVAVARAFQHSVVTTASIVVPSSLGLYLIAPEFVTLLLGEEWAPAIVPIQCLALISILRLGGSLIAPLYTALGRPDVNFRVALITKPIFILSLILLARSFGILGVVAAVGIDNFLVWVLFLWLNGRALRIPLISAYRHLGVPLLLGLAMAPVWQGMTSVFDGLQGLMLGVLACGLTYALLYVCVYRLWTWRLIYRFALFGPGREEEDG